MTQLLKLENFKRSMSEIESLLYRKPFQIDYPFQIQPIENFKMKYVENTSYLSACLPLELSSGQNPQTSNLIQFTATPQNSHSFITIRPLIYPVNNNLISILHGNTFHQIYLAGFDLVLKKDEGQRIRTMKELFPVMFHR